MSQELIREFIEITENMFKQPEQILVEDVVVEQEFTRSLDPDVQDKLEHLIFKLRNYQDPDSGDYAAGVEAGMSKAADMIQNLIERLKGD